MNRQFALFDNINSITGLVLYNEEADIYLAVLRSFVPNALKVIEKLRNVSEETLSQYITNVHGLKSICAGIGAEETRDAALNLELTAKSGNLSGVLAGNEALLTEAGKLASDIQAWLEEFDIRNPKPLLESPDCLLLTRLKKSCEAYDINGIDEVMDTLESADYKSNASLVPWLRERVDALDFSSIASRLSLYEENLT